LPAAGLPAKIVKSADGGYELSLYARGEAAPAEIAAQLARLKAAFPKTERLLFNLIAERVVEHGFTAERLADAVSHVIDTFRYKELNVADIVQFDRRAKLYTEREFIQAQLNGERHTEFERRDVGGSAYWVKKTDMLKQ
jgi:hypothetical protein